MTEPKTIAGLKVVELPMPDFVQFALVGQRDAAIVTTGGTIVMAERQDGVHWLPKKDASDV